MTCAEAQAFDARAIQHVGIPQPVLMENAGRAAAAVLQELFPVGRVVGVVGAGNNGGDALVALRVLQQWGRDVCAVLAAERAENDPLLHGWPVSVSACATWGDAEWDTTLAGAVVVIDGILGIGVQGAPRPRQAEAIGRINASGVPVLAIDVPSGIDASTGATPGAAVRAAATVSFGAPKLGALLGPARALVGRHVVAEIGFPPLDPDDAAVRVVTPTWARARYPQRGTDTHKNAVGRVLVVAGQVGMGGAAILAARGALASGTGLVRVASVPENRSALQSAVPEALFVDASDHAALGEALSQSDALAVGPGLGTGEAAAKTLTVALEGGSVPTVVDADGLNLAAAGVVDLADVAARRPLLLTPHPGEMSRLCPAPADTEDDRVAWALAGAARFGSTVLLKGAPSIVAGPEGDATIDTQASSDLAVAGMGDVLAGVCAGLLAQGLAPETAGPVGLYVSGRAAAIAGRGAATTPSDVLRWLPEARSESGDAEDQLRLPFVTFDADPAR